MPELPDVEMARRLLDRALRGATVTRASTEDRVIARPQAPAAFRRLLVGQAIKAVERRGKWLRILTAKGARLFSHLGMTGEWVVARPDEPALRFERARIDVTRKRTARSVRYLDARRFGRLLVAKDDIAAWRELGPDLVADGVDAPALAALLGRRRRPIKDALMDQTLLAGIGNILATEGLFRAKVDPRSRTDRLTPAHVRAIVTGLRKAIDLQLASRERAHGGDPRDDFAAYGRAGEPCRRCGATLERIVLGGRSTTFCPGCQLRVGLPPPGAPRGRAK